MDIRVSLPKPEDTTGKEIKKFLRQLELTVHHLQKAVEEMEKEGDLTENTFIIYRFPLMNLNDRESDDEGYVRVHVDDESSKMQDIELEIATV